MMVWLKSCDTSSEERLRLCSYSGLERSNSDSTLTRYGSAVPHTASLACVAPLLMAW